MRFIIRMLLLGLSSSIAVTVIFPSSRVSSWLFESILVPASASAASESRFSMIAARSIDATAMESEWRLSSINSSVGISGSWSGSARTTSSNCRRFRSSLDGGSFTNGADRSLPSSDTWYGSSGVSASDGSKSGCGSVSDRCLLFASVWAAIAVSDRLSVSLAAGERLASMSSLR